MASGTAMKHEKLYLILIIWLNGFKYYYVTLIILFNINHLFEHYSNGFNFCYLAQIILFNVIICLHIVKRFQVLLFNIRNSIYQYSY